MDGAVLDPLELHRLAVVLGTSRHLLQALSDAEESLPELASIRDALVAWPKQEATLAKSVDEEGRVLDSASPELKKLRGALRGAHSKIVRKLESYLATLPERFVVPDASVTIREGRYVIPVRREGKGEVGGIVHDESQTGATLYVEPPASLELMNRVRDLEREEAREVRRVLGTLTAMFVPERDTIAGVLGRP